MSIYDVKDEKVLEHVKQLTERYVELAEQQASCGDFVSLREMYLNITEFLDDGNLEDVWGTEGWDRENEFFSD